jgi:hypothetical protein
MEGIGVGAAPQAVARRSFWPHWAEFLWFGYLAWALPYFFVKYWPVIHGWAGGGARH